MRSFEEAHARQRVTFQDELKSAEERAEEGRRLAETTEQDYEECLFVVFQAYQVFVGSFIFINSLYLEAASLYFY